MLPQRILEILQKASYNRYDIIKLATEVAEAQREYDARLVEGLYPQASDMIRKQ